MSAAVAAESAVSGEKRGPGTSRGKAVASGVGQARSWLLLDAEGALCGLPVERITEVLSDEIMRAPDAGAPAEVCGVVEMHHRRVPVIDLGRRLGVPLEHSGRVLVVESQGRQLGLRVGRVLQMVSLPAEVLQSLPPLARTPANEFVAGVAPADNDGWLLLLDIDGLFRIREQLFDVREKGLGAMANQEEADQVQEPSWQECIELLDHLPSMDLEERVRSLERLVRNSSPGIRSRALRMGAAVLADETLVTYLRNDADGVLRNAGLEMLKMRGNRGFSLSVELLRDPDPDVALQAVLVLDHLKDPRALEPLRGQLRHEDPNIVQAVITAIGHLGDARTIPDLLPFLESDPWLQAAAIEALGDVRSPVAVEHLDGILSDMMMGPLAAEALARIGGVKAYRSLGRYWLDNTDEVDEETVVGLLAHVLEGLPRFPQLLDGLGPALSKLLHGEDTSLRASAARALLALGPSDEDTPALSTLVEIQQEATLLPACLSERQDLIAQLLAAEDRRRAWGLLLCARFPKAVPIDALVTALGAPLSEDWLDLTAVTLSKLRARRVAEALLDLYLQLPPAHRPQLAPALTVHKSSLRQLMEERELGVAIRLVLDSTLGETSDSLEAELEALSDEERLGVLSQLGERETVLRQLPWQRWLEARPEFYGPLAAEAALASGLRALLPSLRRVLELTPSPELVRAMGELGDRESVPLLVDLLGRGDSDYEPVLLESLGRIGGPEVRATLREVAESDDDSRSRIAYKSLSLCAVEDDDAFFRAAVDHEDWYVRLACAEVLGRFHRPENLAVLAQLAADPVPIVAQRAMAVLDPEAGGK